MTAPKPPAVFPDDAFPPPPAGEAEPATPYDGASLDDTPAEEDQ